MKKPTAVSLNQDQTKALEALCSDRNVFLTGGAGVGKSTLINYYKKHHNSKIETLCSTGLASVLIGGRTFHSFFGIGIMNEPLEMILAKIQANPRMVSRLLRTNEILIDEVSMLTGKALDYASYICKIVRKDERPFGGMRVICVGDFFQLGPVTKGREKTDWAFNSITWGEADFVNIELREFMRTKDEHFLKVLASVRRGLVGPEVTKFLNSKVLRPGEEFVGTRIFARRDAVQTYNEKKLSEINKPLHIFKTFYTGDTAAVQKLKRSFPVDDEIQIKEGAFVMIRVNDSSKEREYVNGTLGFVDDIYGDRIGIRTLDNRYIRLEPHVLELKDSEGDVIATGKNLMISVSYAITCHKSQGSSIDSALVTGNNLFSSGQFYTAISRLTNSEGLKITGWDRKSIFVDKEVIEFYRKIKNPVLK